MRLIDADTMREEWLENGENEYVYDTNAFLNSIDEQPTIEAVPVVHGEWFLLDECANAGVYCSVCHKKVYREQYANQKIKSKFCPNCGADMRKGDANQ